jgi:AhpC/TSA family
MKWVLFIVIAVLFKSTTFCQANNFCNEKLVDYLGNTISNEQLKKGTTVFLITSYTCGPCVQNIPKYNKLKTDFPKVNFVGILDNDSNYIANFKKQFGKEFWFSKISDPNLSITNKYWKKQVWPQYHIYNNAKRLKVLIDASDKTFNKLVATLQKLEVVN